MSFGVFACVIETVRVDFLFALGPSLDVTWTYTDSMIWTAVELSVAVTCASIPTMAPLLKKAHRGPDVRGLSRSHGYLLSSRVSNLKAKLKQIWGKSSQADGESLEEFRVGQHMMVGLPRARETAEVIRVEGNKATYAEYPGGAR